MINKSKVLKIDVKDYTKKIILAFVGVMLIGFAIAFNSSSMLGNDPISVFFDGIRNIAGFNAAQLGIATNIVNYTLMVLVFLMNRKYINIGTFIYTLPLGSFVSLGFKLYNALGIPKGVLFWQIFSFVIGCFMLFLGIAIFIVVEIGLDPWTGLIMIICDKTKKSFRLIKMSLDLAFTIIGFILGGKIGVVTAFAIITGGPTIQKLSEVLNITLLKVLKINKKQEESIPKTSI